jgi:SulP family sulfate permease
VLLLCGLLRMGFLANFSRPVMSGFTVGSATVIAFDQLHTLLGAPVGRCICPAPRWASARCCCWCWRACIWRRCWALRPAAALADIGAKLAPMAVVLGGIALMAPARLAEMGVRTTGACRPACRTESGDLQRSTGAPAATGPADRLYRVPDVDVGAQALALKRNEKLVSNHELIGLGAANVASACRVVSR